MNIEEVAAADPNAILQVPVDVTKGLQPAQVNTPSLALSLSLSSICRAIHVYIVD